MEIFDELLNNSNNEPNALAIFSINIERTQMLITAIDKIKAYNTNYQSSQFRTNFELGKNIRDIQEKELSKIQRSCTEQAIISLVIAFESYYKELLNEIIHLYPGIFVSQNTIYSDKLNSLLEGEKPLNIEDVERELKLRNRFDYFKLFKAYSIEFVSDEETEIIEYLYTIRNYLVHCSQRKNSKTESRLKEITRPLKHKYLGLSTEAKRLLTKMIKIVGELDKRVKKCCNVLNKDA